MICYVLPLGYNCGKPFMKSDSNTCVYSKLISRYFSKYLVFNRLETYESAHKSFEALRFKYDFSNIWPLCAQT